MFAVGEEPASATDGPDMMRPPEPWGHALTRYAAAAVAAAGSYLAGTRLLNWGAQVPAWLEVVVFGVLVALFWSWPESGKINVSFRRRRTWPVSGLMFICIVLIALLLNGQGANVPELGRWKSVALGAILAVVGGVVHNRLAGEVLLERPSR